MKLTREYMTHLLQRKIDWDKNNPVTHKDYAGYIETGLGKQEPVSWQDVKDYIDSLESGLVRLATLFATGQDK